MLQAIVRPEREAAVIAALEAAGFAAMTKWDVVGRGRQGGIQVGAAVYGELAKSLIMVVVPDDREEAAVEAIMTAARTGQPGDGRIFSTEVRSAWTVRTGKPEAIARGTP